MSRPNVAPMLAVAGELPPAYERDRWAWEMKWDGVRALAYIEDGRLTLVARSGREITAAYPELAGLATGVGAGKCILDGEIVALDSSGTPSFSALQPRIHVRDAAQAAALAREQPVTYMIFDLLQLDETSLLSLPYELRRSTLDELEVAGEYWRTPPTFDGSGEDALAESARLGLEGVVAKRLRSRYDAGRRSDTWRKIKLLRTQEVIIGGWRTGSGSRATTLGALLTGVPDAAGGLHYAGRVGTGFTMDVLHDLLARLRPLETAQCPFTDDVPALDARGAHWAEPGCWSARWASHCGRETAGCGIRAGAASARTSHRTMSSSSHNLGVHLSATDSGDAR